jgi:hypothetical protein
MNISGTMQAVTAALAAIAVVIWLQLSVFGKQDENAFGKTESNDIRAQMFKQTVDYTNKDCPKMLDDKTRIDSVAGLPGKIFAEYFTLLNTDVSAIDTSSFKALMRASTTNTIKTNSGFDALRNYGTTFMYSYRDKDGKPFVAFSVTPGQYNN